MESLKEKRLEKRKSKMKKIIIASSIVATLGVGTSAFASTNDLSSGFNTLVTNVITPFFPQIEKELDKAGKDYAKDVAQHVKDVANAIPNTLKQYKDDQIRQGKDELKAYHDEKIKSIDDTANTEINVGEQQIDNEVSGDVQKGKDQIDAALASEQPKDNKDEKQQQNN